MRPWPDATGTPRTGMGGAGPAGEGRRRIPGHPSPPTTPRPRSRRPRLPTTRPWARCSEGRGSDECTGQSSMHQMSSPPSGHGAAHPAATRPWNRAAAIRGHSAAPSAARRRLCYRNNGRSEDACPRRLRVQRRRPGRFPRARPPARTVSGPVEGTLAHPARHRRCHG